MIEEIKRLERHSQSATDLIKFVHRTDWGDWVDHELEKVIKETPAIIKEHIALLEHNKALVEALELAKNLFYVITCSNNVTYMETRAQEGLEEIKQALTTYKGA